MFDQLLQASLNQEDMRVTLTYNRSPLCSYRSTFDHHVHACRHCGTYPLDVYDHPGPFYPRTFVGCDDQSSDVVSDDYTYNSKFLFPYNGLRSLE